MVPIRITQNPSNQSTTVIAASQSPVGPVNLTLATTSAFNTGISQKKLSNGIDISGTTYGGSIIGITSSADDHTITFTVTGIDNNGLNASEVITGASGAPGTAVSTKFYSVITSIKTSGSSAGTVTVGTVNTTLSTCSTAIELNHYNRVAHQVSVQVTGTINFSVQETFDPVMDQTVSPSSAIWVTPSAFSGKTSNTNGQLDVGATACRLVINSYSNGATATVNIIAPSQGSS